MRRALLAVLLLLVPILSGCTAIQDIVDQITAPDADVFITPLEEGGAWNTETTFTVRAEYTEPLSVRIEATDGTYVLDVETPASEARQTNGTWGTEATLEFIDGVWDITLYVDGHKWDTLKGVAIDGTAPEVHGLESFGDATDRAYTLGAGASADADGTVSVIEQGGGTVGTGLPLALTGLTDGVHVYDVVIRDAAGNENVYTVQVRAGSAKFLPEGQFTAGIVARYTNQLRLWDLSDPGAYLSRSGAQAAQSSYLGSGFGIDPDAPEVQDVVSNVVTSGMNTMEAALALYEWLFDNLEYTEERLAANDLLGPADTISNGGGVCRDLAGLYVSLLRAAGVPARITTGYVAGNVNGFHAWADFYGGDVAGNPGPWIPVDVSPIDGRWTDAAGGGLRLGPTVLLQSFGVARPDYLPLRDLPPSAEVDGWSTAISVQYPENGPSPSFETDLDVLAPVYRFLCVDVETYVRSTAWQEGQCAAHYLRDFPWQMEQVIDYGILTTGSATVTFAYPIAADLAPDQVEYAVYGPGARQTDPATATVTIDV